LRSLRNPCSKELLDCEEAMTMMSDVAKEIILRAAERDGWLTARDLEKAKVIAKKMLLKDMPIEEIIEITELPYETVTALNQS